jgi:DNA replication ATP-dependent helicase Dna2
MKEAALADFFFREIRRLLADSDTPERVRVEKVRYLLSYLFETATRSERLHFSTTYARIAYTGHKYGLSGRRLFHLHRFRLSGRRPAEPGELTDRAWLELGAKLVVNCAADIWSQPIPEDLEAISRQPYPLTHRAPDIVDFRSRCRVVALEIDAEAEQIIARPEERVDAVVRIQYNVPDRNADFTDTIQIIEQVVGLPCLLNLLDSEIDQAGVYYPAAFVVEPDYLIDVTAVSESFVGNRTLAWGYLANKLMPKPQRPALLRGTITNHFLDELIHRPEATFRELKQEIFGLNPLAFCSLSDREVRELVQSLQRHFLNLKALCTQGLERQGIERDNCQLEPSFYAPDYGIQGRLDLLHLPQVESSATDDTPTSIIELKSGSVFMPNRHKLSSSHYVQTLLYDLMVRSAFGEKTNVAGYIMYSKEEQDPLRFAPRERQRQREAIAARNRILAIDYLLANIYAQAEQLQQRTDQLFQALDPLRHTWVKGFTRDNLERVARAYRRLEPIEQKYLGAFLGFSAREQRLAKTGEQGVEAINGLASLWLDEPATKAERFERLSALHFADYDATEAILHFSRKEATDQLVKFRAGDVLVLYPTPDPADRQAVLRNQVFKCTLIELSPERVILRLRSRQSSDRFFRKFASWTIEKDVLDSGFAHHYRGLFAWAESRSTSRQLWMGIRPPRQGQVPELPALAELTAEQYDIMGRVLAAPDYFLLWGPPGTGKTSMMLHHLVAYLLEHTEEQILLMAYTNRAVDEICESLERIGGGFRDYLRIGSRYGTAPEYQDRLLRNQIAGIQTRRELKALLDRYRIVVGTVASLAGKSSLFELKRFDRLIIDEASQILEPQLVGLLSRVPRVLLIGDHRQLPAVVSQRPEEASISDPDLRELGYYALADSLFERLFQRAQQQGWHWAYAMLSHQGRMHRDLMAFPSQAFYDGHLSILPTGVAHRATQESDLALTAADPDDLARLLATHRLVFCETASDPESTDFKTNGPEARLVTTLIQHFDRLYQTTDRPIQPGDIGIITPYRAQIARIRQELRASGLDPDHYTVDTVERYQGGARRIILISLCTNREVQMSTLSTLSREGVDRKLNVAMTRAREHLVLLGNPQVLRESAVYAQLLAYCRTEAGYHGPSAGN